MGPPGPREEIQLAIEHTGCKLREDPARGGFFLVDCPSFVARAQLVDALAWHDALTDGELRLLALDLVAPLVELDAESIARAIHAGVRDRVRYLGEAGDMIQDPIVTWSYAAGDCDCHARLVLALLRSLGVSGVFVGFEVPGPAARGGAVVQHACPTWERSRGDCVWMETTLEARFGEHPMDAAERLGLLKSRSDLR